MKLEYVVQGTNVSSRVSRRTEVSVSPPEDGARPEPTPQPPAPFACDRRRCLPPHTSVYSAESFGRWFAEQFNGGAHAQALHRGVEEGPRRRQARPPHSAGHDAGLLRGRSRRLLRGGLESSSALSEGLLPAAARREPQAAAGVDVGPVQEPVALTTHRCVPCSTLHVARSEPGLNLSSPRPSGLAAPDPSPSCPCTRR